LHRDFDLLLYTTGVVLAHTELKDTNRTCKPRRHSGAFDDAARQ